MARGGGKWEVGNERRMWLGLFRAGVAGRVLILAGRDCLATFAMTKAVVIARSRFLAATRQSLLAKDAFTQSDPHARGIVVVAFLVASLRYATPIASYRGQQEIISEPRQQAVDATRKKYRNRRSWLSAAAKRRVIKRRLFRRAAAIFRFPWQRPLKNGAA